MKKLFVHCHDDFRCSLSQEGQDWKREFTTLPKALDFAREMVNERTPLIVYSSRGNIIVNDSIAPKALVPAGWN